MFGFLPYFLTQSSRLLVFFFFSSFFLLLPLSLSLFLSFSLPLLSFVFFLFFLGGWLKLLNHRDQMRKLGKLFSMTKIMFVPSFHFLSLLSFHSPFFFLVTEKKEKKTIQVSFSFDDKFTGSALTEYKAVLRGVFFSFFSPLFLFSFFSSLSFSLLEKIEQKRRRRS